MPALPPVPGVMKLILGGTYHDARWVNIYYVAYTGSAPSSANIEAYFAAVTPSIATAYQAEMSADNEWTSIEGIDLASDTGATYSEDASVFGVRAGDFLPASVAMVASLEISRRYRGGHPRKYLPWGTAGTMASGSTIDWDSSFLADCQLKFDAMMAAMIGVTEGGTTWSDLVNVSYVTAKARRDDPVVDVITSAILRPRMCTQRRRLGRIGG